MRLSIRQYALALLEIERELSGTSPQEVGQRFAAWLLRRGERQKLGKIVAEAERITQERSGVVPVTVTTACPTDQDTQELLLVQTGKLFPGKKIEARFQTDREVLGGAKIRSAEKLYDGSVRAVLQDFSRAIIR